MVVGMDKLLPCPFCGSEDVSINEAYWDCHGARYEASCNNPQCAVHPYSDLYDTEAEAAEAWNTRADDYRQAAEYWQRMYEESFTERTCKRITLGLEREREIATVSWICSACGKHMSHDDNYCPNCGARVVSE